jgi:hypothetical protein
MISTNAQKDPVTMSNYIYLTVAGWIRRSAGCTRRHLPEKLFLFPNHS